MSFGKHPNKTSCLLGPNFYGSWVFLFKDLARMNRVAFFVDGFNLYHAIAGNRHTTIYKYDKAIIFLILLK